MNIKYKSSLELYKIFYVVEQNKRKRQILDSGILPMIMIINNTFLN